MTHWHRFPAQDYEVLCSLHHETSELVAQYSLYFICLLYLDAETDRVDGRFDENALVLIARDGQWVEEDFL
jgi:hypothetical protein